MSLKEALQSALDLVEAKGEPEQKSEAEQKKANEKALKDKIVEQEKEIAEVFANALAVALSQVENMVGLHFDSVDEAERFYKEFSVILRGRRRSELLMALRRFERLGGAKTQAIYRRGLQQ